jgi:GT2 family glycosyltransferase
LPSREEFVVHFSALKVSFVLSTRNRCDVLLNTLRRLQFCGLDAGTFDVHVVDNASTDGTPRRVKAAFPKVRVHELKQNLGSVAKNVALDRALGTYIVFLDDDSYPTAGSVQRMIGHFEADARLGAATFTVTLPDGRQECSAYPDVFIGCGVGFRRRVLRLMGGLPTDFFMQAEEYDLSLRLIDCGWKVKTFDDLHVMHLKTPTARVHARTMRLDVRNNLYVLLRRVPKRWVVPYAIDWMRRYAWIADSKSLRGAFLHGLIEGTLRTIVRPKRAAVSAEAFEQFAKLDVIRERLKDVTAEHGAKRVILVDLGKNVYAYWRACRELGLEIVAIADGNLASPGRRYRGVPVLDDAAARKRKADLIVVSNLSPVHARKRADHWRLTQGRPVVDLFSSEIESRFAVTSGRPAGSRSLRIVARSA